ncbi:MAG: hypothetical protein QF893_09900 [Alphaproteobacteria bacterium]|jgi:hypothetical protein|nr:hypothetical protein [Alphaproteobacteria bacterium]
MRLERRRFGFRTAMVLPALLLAACVTRQQADVTAPQPEVAAATVTPQREQTPTVTPIEAAREDKRPRFGRAPRPASSSPSAQVAARQTVRLAGLRGTDLVLLLGQPSLQRRDPPAEVWQYVGPRCTLHVFFYSAGAAADYRVMHVDAIDRGGARAEPEDCLARLLDAAKNADRSS